MRVSEKMLFDTSVLNLNKAVERVLRAQEEVSTGRKVQRPSDDPVGTGLILDFRTSIANLEQYQRNITWGRTALGGAEAALSGLTGLLARAKELAVGQASGTATAETRDVTAIEVRQILAQVLSVGNTRVNDKYIFSGFATSTAPFTAGSYATYNGTADTIDVAIDPSVTLATNLIGSQVFQGAGGVYGSTNVLDTLDDLATAMETNDVPTIQTIVGTLDNALDQVSAATADLGARWNRLDEANFRHVQVKTQLRSLLSDREDVDMIKAASELTIGQQTLEAARASTARILQSSLLDFLR